MSASKPTRFYFTMLLVYGTLTTGLVLFLSFELYQKQSQIARLKTESNPREGALVPSFVATGATGDALTVHFDGGDPITVLCFLSSDCEFCHEAAASWNQLTRIPGLRVIGVAVDGVGPFSRRTDWRLTFPVVEIMDPATRSAYGISHVPLTLAVDSSGIVVLSLTGLPDEGMLSRIQSLADGEIRGKG